MRTAFQFPSPPREPLTDAECQTLASYQQALLAGLKDGQALTLTTGGILHMIRLQRQHAVARFLESETTQLAELRKRIREGLPITSEEALRLLELETRMAVLEAVREAWLMGEEAAKSQG